MSLAGQTINDRLLAARHSLAGQGLAKSVCKATTEELIAPKKKHLDYLVHCTNEPNVSIPHLANLLIERSQSTNWIVVYKSLLSTHHLLAYGNERFIQYLASSNTSFNLGNFLDKGGVQGAPNARLGYDMSPFIRRYAKYLNEKALSYRAVAFDFCKVKRGKEEGSLRTMNTDKLLKTLPTLQSQLDALLEFDCQANDLTNGVINMCFMLLFRDLIRLFACYNDGIINLLEKYFDMNKKQARDALDLYKRFLVRMDKVGEFLKVAENVGIDKGDIPDLTKAPSSLLDALEQHLANLEGRKISAANTPTQSASNQKNNVKSAVSALSSTSSSFGTAATSTKFDNSANGIDESVKAQALAEEEAAMNQYKSKVSSPTLTNPFLSSPPASQANTNIVDLFSNTGATNTSVPTKASDDLLQLGNPFADMFGASAAPAAPIPGANNLWMSSNGFNGTQSTATNAFVSDSNFSTVFGNTEPSTTNTTVTAAIPNPFFDTDEISSQSSGQVMQQTIQQQFQGFDALGDVLKPAGTGSSLQQQQSQFQTGNTLITGQPQQLQQQPQQQPQPGKILTGDLDSSLASLVDNLGMKSGSTPKPNWSSPKNQAKPGANWQPQPMAATTGANYRPMAQGMTISPAPSTINHQFVHPSYPVLSNYFQQGTPMMATGMSPQPGVMGSPNVMPMGMQSQMIPTGPGMISMQQPISLIQPSNGKPADPFSGL